MKKPYILWLMIFCSMQSMSQSFVSENKLWSIMAQVSFEGHWSWSNFYKFSGDTTINQIQYKKLYESNNENQTYWKINSSWYEKNDSVFQYSDSKGIDILIYNFNLEEKDSFYYNLLEDYLYVDSVRIKQWGNKDRKHIYLKSKLQPYLETVWIQGVGQNGLITRSSEAGIIGAFVKILCFSENGEKVYQSPEYDGCYVRTSIEDLQHENQLLRSIPRNGGRIAVELIESSGGIFSIYTSEGKLNRKIELSQRTTDICFFKKGLYLYRFESSDGRIQTGKVVVK